MFIINKMFAITNKELFTTNKRIFAPDKRFVAIHKRLLASNRKPAQATRLVHYFSGLRFIVKFPCRRKKKLHTHSFSPDKSLCYSLTGCKKGVMQMYYLL
ncbi:MAG: hypothetical protein D3920_03215 [Candidatus Electrothrix sp. AW2]|nr:hypothetical protein [Candidatus Electrothrix gigas]